MEKNENTIYVFQWNADGYDFDNPKKETREEFLNRNDLTTDDDIVEKFKTLPGLLWFMGTEKDYETIYTTNYYYYKKNGDDFIIAWERLQYLNDGKLGTDPTFKELVPDNDAQQISKDEYDILRAKNIEENNKRYAKESLKQDNTFLSAAKVGQQVLLRLISQQINGNQETISMNLSKISENNETVLRKVLSGNSSITDVALLNINARYRSYNTTLHTNNADLEAYSLALSTLKVEEMTNMYNDIINNSMSVGDAFQKEMKDKLPTTKEIQLGKELHETYVIDTIGQGNYNEFLDIFNELDLTTHLEPFTKLKLAPTAHTDTSGIV